MILRMSTLFLRTLREDPADAEVPSHRLLVRAGYVRRAAPGHLHLAAAGLSVLRNVERIVREEMDAIGFQEVHFPALLPREPYEAPGRWTEYGDTLPLKDRKGADYLLGPTHEELFTAPGEGPVLVVQGPAAVDLPDPDEVPRRGPAPRRHPARARVPHEGLVLLRRRRRRARSVATTSTARPTSRSSTGSASTTSSSRRCPARWAARRARSSSRPAETGEDTFVPLHELRLRGERRGGHHGPGARPIAVRRSTGRPRRGHARTRRRSRRWSRMSTSVRPARATGLDRRRHAEERPGQGWSHPDGTSRAAGDRRARRPRDRPQAARRAGLARPRSRRSTTRTSRRTRAWSGATSARRRSARRPAGIRYLLDPASSTAPRGSPAPTSRAGTSSTSSPAATSPATAPIEAAEVRAGDPARSAAAR